MNKDNSKLFVILPSAIHIHYRVPSTVQFLPCGAMHVGCLLQQLSHLMHLCTLLNHLDLPYFALHYSRYLCCLTPSISWLAVGSKSVWCMKSCYVWIVSGYMISKSYLRIIENHVSSIGLCHCQWLL